MSSPSSTFLVSGDTAETSPVASLPAGAPTTITSGEGAPAAGEVIPIEEDERRGLPSASSFQRYATCPASLPLEYILREAGELLPDHGGEDAERGDRIHEILMGLATGNPKAKEGHLPAEIEVAESLWGRAQELLAKVFPAMDGVEFVIEQRIWLQDGHGQPMASGRFDLLAIHEEMNLAVVLDYKSGWREVSPAPVNRQLRFGAVCVREAYGVTNVTGIILQPYKPANWAGYGDLDIEDALEEIDDILALKKRDPFEVGFVRGDHCTYCPCRLSCPRLQWDKAQLQASPLAIIASASDEKLGEFGKALKSLEHLKRAWEKEATWRIHAGRFVPGWKLEISKARRSVTNAVGVANLLMAKGAPKDDVLAAMSINVGDAEAIFKAATKLKGKECAAVFNEATAGMIEKVEPEPTLKPA